MKLQRQIDNLQALRASEWYELLKQGRAQDMAAFQDWCRKSPLHIEEFLKTTWTDRVLNGLDADRSIDLDTLLQELPHNVHTLSKATGVKTRSAVAPALSGRQRKRWLSSLAAAVAALAIMCAAYWHFRLAPQEFSTKIGELRTVELQDASIVTLNTDSGIEVQFRNSARDVELRRGEAVFQVAHDPARPFRVHTVAGTVQAIGTQFNVYARADGTDVAVLEGRVRLMPHATNDAKANGVVELEAGEQARIALDGRIHRAERADVERATVWSKRRLKFDETPLEEIVHEFNRYHRDPRLRLKDVPPGTHHYSGIFDADDPEMLATLLENEPDLAIERRDGEIVIRAKEQGGR